MSAVTIGPYRIRGALGRGGMGLVFRGEHAATGAAAAIKVVPGAAPRFAEAIRREIDSLRRVEHPGVVRILDQGIDEGRPWYAMELLDGPSLRASMQGAPAPPVLPLLAALCEPLAALHAAGIVHRDLKPENVIVVDGRPVLVDFGIAAGFSGAAGREVLAAAGEAIGTAAYMAPEEIRGELPDARADLYALGCMLYECLAGRPPFVGAAADVVAQHLARAPIDPSLLVEAEVPPAVAALVLALLAKRPAERPGYAEDVAAALAAAGFGAPSPSRRAAAYLYRAELVGRDGVMRRLDERLDGLAARAGGGLVLVRGEAGVGKTRLALELARRAAQRGITVVTGAGREGPDDEAPPLGPFRPLVAAAADRAIAGGAAVTAGLFGAHAKVLAPYVAAVAALPGVAEMEEPAPLSPAAARARVLDVLLALVRALGAASPLVVLLDNVQWADDLSLALLARMEAEALREARVLCVVLASTDGGGATSELGTRGAEVIELARLDVESVGAMAAGMLALRAVPRAWARALAEWTVGNPFFLVEWLRAAIGSGRLVRDARGRWSFAGAAPAGVGGEVLPVPARIEALLTRRLHGLDDAEVAFVRAAAAIGRVFEASLVAAAADLDERVLLDAVSGLARRRVVEEAGDGRLRFAHERLRAAALDGLDPAATRALHGRVADAIARAHGADPAWAAARGRHLAEAGRCDEARVHLAAAAAHAAAAFANEEAIALARAALVAARASAAPPSFLVDGEEQLGDLLVRAGRLEEAGLAYARAFEAASTSTGARRAALHLRRGKSFELRQRHADALACYARADEELDAPIDDDEVVRARARVQIGIERIQVHYFAGDLPALARVVAELAPLLDRAGTAAQRARFFQSLVQRDLRGARYRPPPVAVENARRSVAAFVETGDREESATARFTLAAVLLWSDALDEAEAEMLAALDEAERIGSQPLQARCLAYLATICRRRGDFDAARAFAWRGASVAGAAGMTDYAAAAEANLGWALLREAEEAGDPDTAEAEAQCRAAVERWRGSPLAWPFEWQARLPLLCIAHRDGRLDEARAHAAALLAPAQQILPDELRAALEAVAAAPDPEALPAALARVVEAARSHGFA